MFFLCGGKAEIAGIEAVLGFALSCLVLVSSVCRAHLPEGWDFMRPRATSHPPARFAPVIICILLVMFAVYWRLCICYGEDPVSVFFWGTCHTPVIK